MADLQKSIKNQGKEFSKILTLKRAGLLTEENIDKYLESDEAKEVARALMRGDDAATQQDASRRSLFKAVDRLDKLAKLA